MNFEKLIELSHDFGVSIANDDTFKMTPPYYYDSLRNAFQAFFKTFQSTNSMYQFYAEGLSRIESNKLSSLHVDTENISLCMVGLERFFELYLKDLMGTIEPRLIQRPKNPKHKNPSEKISSIENDKFESKRYGSVIQYINFYETIELYFHISTQIKKGEHNSILDSIAETITKHDFLSTDNSFATLKYLNWYRDRLLHDGSQVPSLWLFDYFITQHICPLLIDLFQIENDSIKGLPFYLKTLSGINILENIAKIKFDFEELKDKSQIENVQTKLLYIGHLKELGRANFNMNNYTRNGKSTFEYNYHDIFGRGERFAESEEKHENFKGIKSCPCCTKKTLVLYSMVIEDIFNKHDTLNIQWVKCYICDYHIRYNVGDPVFFNLSDVPIFDFS